MASEVGSSETVFASSSQGETKQKITAFQEVNTEAKAESILEKRQPPGECRTRFTEPDMPLELRAKIIQKLLQPVVENTEEVVDGLVPMVPLANPKGVKYICSSCSMPGRYYCAACGVTYYCSLKHRDNDSMHASQCLKMGFIRGSKEQYDLSLQRYRIMAQKALVTASLLEEQFCDAIENLYGGHLDVAIVELQFCLAYVPEIWGINSTEAITIFIFMGEAYLQLSMLAKANFAIAMALFQVNALEKEDKNIPLNCTKSLIYRTQGNVDMRLMQHSDAIWNFSECVYHSTDAFGVYDPRVCAGYYNLGRAFVACNKTSQGLCTLAFCTDIWMTYLCQRLDMLVSDDPTATRKTETTLQADNGPFMPRMLQLDGYAQLFDIQSIQSERMEEKSEVYLKTILCLGIIHFSNHHFSHAHDKAHHVLEMSTKSHKSNLRSSAKILKRLCTRRNREN